MVVECFEVVVDAWLLDFLRCLLVVVDGLGGFKSFHVLVTTHQNLVK